jgi:hypothetical protein
MSKSDPGRPFARTAYRKLIARLEEIEDQAKRAQDGPNWYPDLSVCLAVQAQLVALHEFLRPAQADYLDRMIVALTEISAGRRVAWLEPKYEAPSIPLKIRLLRGRYAGIMEFLFRNGMREIEAAKFVAKHGAVSRLQRGSKKRPDWEALRDWRNLAKADPASCEGEGYRHMAIQIASYGDAVGRAKTEHKKMAEKIAKLVLSALDSIPLE